MRKHLLLLGLAAAMWATWTGAAWGQAASSPASQPAGTVTATESMTKTVTETAPPPVDSVEEFIQKTKHPVSWFSWGADVRLREVYTPSLLLNEEDRHFQRFRERVWFTMTPCSDFEWNARLVYEPKHFCLPDRVALTRNGAYIDEWTTDEAIFDQMNVVWRPMGSKDFKLTIGRQDIILGNGWLVLDGTPLDGSRTIFFDAVRATYEAKACQTTFDVIYIQQYADTDNTLPPFCDKDFLNMEQDEKGAILWIANKSLAKTEIDGYFIYKHDDKVLGTEPKDLSPGNSAPWQRGDNADLYTVGARVVGDIDEHWKYRAEYALQFGNKNGEEHLAQGFNSQLAYFLNDKWNNNFRVGYEYLSGDRPGTGTDEQFDQLWGRWPQWSELLVYTTGLEHRPGEITNFHRVNVGWSCNPCKNLEWKNDYHLLFRDQKFDPVGPQAGWFDQGCFRGQLLTSLLKYKINDHISTHVIGELFFPGSFYSDTRNEVGGFFRYEINFTW